MFINAEACPCEHCGKLSNLTHTNSTMKKILDEINSYDIAIARQNEDPEMFLSSNVFNKVFEDLARQYMTPYMIRLDREMYKEVFKAAKSGGNLAIETTNGDFDSICRDYYVATSNLYFIPQYGSDSIKLIIPKGVQVYNVAGIGHSGYYDVDTNTSNDFKFYLFDWMLASKKSKGWFC